MSYRKETVDLMRACERLISLAKKTGSLTPEESQIASFYAKELHTELSPYCSESPNISFSSGDAPLPENFSTPDGSPMP
jgi:hypothetical protein